MALFLVGFGFEEGVEKNEDALCVAFFVPLYRCWRLWGKSVGV